MPLLEEKKDFNKLIKWEQLLNKKTLILLLISFFMNIALVILIISLFPLKEKENYLLFFSSYDTNFVTIKKAGENLTADTNLIKSLLANYVKNRETINRINDIERYEETRLTSDRKVWLQFESLVKAKNSIYSTNNTYREINIINVSINSINKSDQQGIALIDYVANTYNNNLSVNETIKYRATLKFGFQEVETNFESVPKNPTGFTIYAYDITRINDIQ